MAQFLNTASSALDGEEEAILGQEGRTGGNNLEDGQGNEVGVLAGVAGGDGGRGQVGQEFRKGLTA